MSSTWRHRIRTCFPKATPPRQRAAQAACGLLLTAVAGLGGCASGGASHLVEINRGSPTPLVDPLPLTVAVHYSAQLQDYSTEQESLNGDSWQVVFKSAQRDDIHRMLTGVFEQVIEAPAPDVPNSLVYDVLVVPRVENFAFLTPAESGSKFFAVSMRHYVSFYRPDGTDLGEWEINSYGRSRSYFRRPLNEMAEEAVVDAMRDLATTLVIGLPEELVRREIVDMELPGALR